MEDTNFNTPMPTPPAPPAGGSKKIVWLVLGLALLAVAAYFVLNAKKPVQTGDGAEQTKEQTTTKNQSLTELIASGSPQKCEFTSQTPNGEAKGSMSIANGKMRSHIITTVNGQQQGNNTLSDGQYLYIWTDGQTTGYKISAELQKDAQPAVNANNIPNQDANANAEYDYNCKESKVDENTFKVPDGISFGEMPKLGVPPAGASAGIQAEGSVSGAPTKAQMCASCNSLSGDEKTQCLTALQCP